MPASRVRVEEFEVTGEKLVASLKDLVHKGNIRRIAIRNEKGVTLIEIPLLAGLASAVLAPVWAAVGAVAALLVRCTIVIERVDDGADRAKSRPRRTRKAA
jgi:Flp pilus assembly pilin Flp